MADVERSPSPPSLLPCGISVHLRDIVPRFIYPVDRPRERCVSPSVPRLRETFLSIIEREGERNISERRVLLIKSIVDDDFIPKICRSLRKPSVTDEKNVDSDVSDN